MSQLHHSRTILTIVALLAILASGMSGVRLDKASHACDGMAMGVTMDDCRDHHMGSNPGDGAAMPDCAAFVCAAGQTALPALDAFHHSFAILTLSAQPALRDDALLHDLRGPPDLRPPIA